ncbi:hypothetical protein COMA1_30165 [Candidatus Nitrospira nitrosa]|uniref:Uncharacterized protein n=1 Tax=Candidatus Nitrospira nitrosa TaxID=1742972 RepID=A0A0S4LKY8_9BACT|nr:hypothetical protein COMA1_30165 [Candidatus Nitrospira nitrosa]
MLEGLSELPARYSPDVRDLRQGSLPELVLGFVKTLLTVSRLKIADFLVRDLAPCTVRESRFQLCRSPSPVAVLFSTLT